MSCKLVFVGSTCSGKTQILITYTLKQFPTDYIPTVFENYDTFIKFQDRTVKLGLWDTAGQEEYDRLRYLSYPNTNVVAICFSTVNRTSFFDVEDKWLPEIKEHCPEASIMLIGTHIRSRANREHEGDPVDPLEIISTEEGMELARKIKAERYLEVNCTAQEVRGVNEIFETAIELYFSKEKPRESASSSSSSVGDRSLRRKSLSLINYNNNNNNNGTSPTTRKRLSAILFPSSWFKDLTTSEASIDSRGGNSPISLRSSLRDSNNNNNNNSFTSSSSSGGGTGPDISLNSLNNQNNANSDTSSTTTNSARSRITEDEAEREIIQLRKQVALLTASLDEQKNLAQALELRVAELQEYIRTMQAREAKLAAQLASAVAVASSTTTNTSNANANNNCSNSNSNTQPKRRIERHAIDIGNSSSDKGNIAIASVESLIDKKLSAFAEILREHTVRHDNQIAAYQKMLEAALGARTMPSPQYQCSNEMLQQQQQQEQQQQQREERAIEGSQQAQRANDEAPKQEQVDLTEELPPAAEKVSSELRNANERNGSHDIIASETELCNTATSM